MTQSIADLLITFRPGKPVNASLIRQIETEAHLSLPEDYANFLETVNGGEGFIGPNSYVILWSAEELLRLNRAYQVD